MRDAQSRNGFSAFVALIAAPDGRAVALARVFAHAAFVPVLAFDERQLRRLTEGSDFDVVIADQELDAHGEVLEAVADAEGLAVLLADGHDASSRRVHAVMPKNSEPIEIARRAQAMLEMRSAEQQPEVWSWGPLRVDPGRRSAAVADAAIDLTPPQWRILSTLVRGRGRIVTKLELQHAAWPGAPVDDGERLMKHVARIRRRLAAHPDGASMIVTVRGEGFRLNDVDGRNGADGADGASHGNGAIHAQGAPWDGVDRRRRDRRQVTNGARGSTSRPHAPEASQVRS